MTYLIHTSFFYKGEKEPLVSIIIPIYNGELTIRNTVESILQQTYNNMEIIIVDDASIDNSYEIISSFKDPRIKPVFLDKNTHF